MVKELNEKDFSSILTSSDTYLVDFWAPWCGPCRMMAPILDEYAKKQDKIKVAKVNVDENPELAQKYNISGIPTLVVLKNGKEIDRVSGLMQLNALEERMSNY